MKICPQNRDTHLSIRPPPLPPSPPTQTPSLPCERASTCMLLLPPPPRKPDLVSRFLGGSPSREGPNPEGRGWEPSRPYRVWLLQDREHPRLSPQGRWNPSARCQPRAPFWARVHIGVAQGRSQSRATMRFLVGLNCDIPPESWPYSGGCSCSGSRLSNLTRPMQHRHFSLNPLLLPYPPKKSRFVKGRS